jgi:hypothetical protein
MLCSSAGAGREHSQREQKANAMNETAADLERTDEAALTGEVSDETLEAVGAAGAGGAPTLLVNSYCFTCWTEGRTDRQTG